MLNKITSFLLSMKTMTLLVLTFFIAVAYATFIENDFGTQTAKALVYNAHWFEVIIVLLNINMLYNIKRYNLLRKEKWPVFLFHISFVVITIGAGITRYVSFEGTMAIRENDSSDLIVSDQTFLQFKVHNNKLQYEHDSPILLHDYTGPLSFLKSNDFKKNVDFLDHDITVEYVDYIKNAKDTLLEGQGDKEIITLVMAGQDGRETFYLEENSANQFLGLNFSFGTPLPGHVNFFYQNDVLMIQLPSDADFMRMADRLSGKQKRDSIQPIMLRSLYSMPGFNFVIPTISENSKVDYYSVKNPEGQEIEDALLVNINCNGETKKLTLFGDKGPGTSKSHFKLGGLNFSMSYGSKFMITPFKIKLNDFQLERYPGSNSPSSFSSEVTLIDGNFEQDHRIYMNNVLDYQGYRFFQSSYDQDELGTILSVNHDFWGTLTSYLGYFLMTLGMIVTVFSKKTRFSSLRKKLKDIDAKRITTVLLLFLTLNSFAVQTNSVDSLILSSAIDQSHADKFGMLVVQDNGGRMKPFSTSSSEILRKVLRKNSYLGLNANQVVLGMAQNPYLWQQASIIKVGNEELQEELGIDQKYTSFLSFFSFEAQYVLTEKVEIAYAKKPALRTKYDKEVIAVDERVNVCYMLYNGSFFSFFPLADDLNNSWFSIYQTNDKFSGDDSLFVFSIMPIYFSSIYQAQNDGDWTVANNTLEAIKNYQQKFGADVYPSETKLYIESAYNEYKVFNKLTSYYAIIGLIMIMLLLQNVLKYRKWRLTIVRVGFYLLIAGFFVHSIGLAARWYISDHAPWSNAYESVIYIAWATLLAGFVFSNKSMMSMAATSIISALLLMVAALNWLDPEITNLVPVLDSYWLMIHVAIITASYGFLALGAILGFINLVLMILQNKVNFKRITNSISELTYINEMSITVGLFLLSIGTFLGGIWANESWGRYWGWDPKETWAFASMLCYIFVLHLRFIPKLKSAFVFNYASLAAYGSIIMTYFGVNFYLSGLHSYAKGDPMPIPTFVYYTIAVVFVVTTIAYFNQKRLKKNG
jgi:cytochrome c-type biogenesis protein CcsB